MVSGDGSPDKGKRVEERGQEKRENMIKKKGKIKNIPPDIHKLHPQKHKYANACMEKFMLNENLTYFHKTKEESMMMEGDLKRLKGE